MKTQTSFKEFARYTSPGVLGMLGLSLYILADTFFVSKALGATGLAALNLALPPYSFIHGSGLMLGMGGATRYSILRAQRDEKAANTIFTHTLALAALLTALFALAGIFLSAPLTTLLGADGTVFGLAHTYLRVTLLFAPVFILNNVLLCFVRNDGAPALAMLAMLGGSFSNIVLDYVFMFPLGMGIFGAVLATGLAPVISMLILSPFFMKRKNHFHPVRCPLSASWAGSICSTGLPSLLGEVSSGTVLIVFNHLILGLSGNTGVAAYGVVANLSLVVLAIYNGIAQGVQPLLSRFHGAGARQGVGRTLRYALLTMAGLSLLLYTGIFFGANFITSVFNSEGDPQLQAIATGGLRLYFTGCIFAGFNILLSVYFTCTDTARPAHIIALLRGFALILPAAFLLSALFGLGGIWAAFPATEAVVALLGAAFALAGLRRKATGLRRI